MSQFSSENYFNSKVEDMYTGFLDIDLDEVGAGIERISSAPIRQIAETFCLNMQSIAFMVTIPYILLLKEQMDFKRLVIEIKARLRSTKPFAPIQELSNVERQSVYDLMREIAAQEPEDKNDKKEEHATIDNEFRFLLESSKEIRSGYRSLLYSGLAWIWSTFEVLCSDLWETSVNESPDVLARKAISGLSHLDKLDETGGLTAKHIRLEYLAKHGYDLRHCMGTLLKSKFDFTSLHGIRQAYRSTFPKSQTISRALDNNELFLLEMKRHLIVHRAGLVDENFINKTGIKLPLGIPIPISDREVLEYCIKVMNVGFPIINSVQSYLDMPNRTYLMHRLTRVLRSASQSAEA